MHVSLALGGNEQLAASTNAHNDIDPQSERQLVTMAASATEAMHKDDSLGLWGMED